MLEWLKRGKKISSFKRSSGWGPKLKNTLLMDKLKGKNTTFFNGGSKNFLSMKFFTIVTIHLCAPLDNCHKIIHMKSRSWKEKKNRLFTWKFSHTVWSQAGSDVWATWKAKPDGLMDQLHMTHTTGILIRVPYRQDSSRAWLLKTVELLCFCTKRERQLSTGASSLSLCSTWVHCSVFRAGDLATTGRRGLQPSDCNMIHEKWGQKEGGKMKKEDSRW